MSRTNIVKCVDDSTKKTIVGKFNKKSFKTKTKLAKEFGISLRTLNRILEEQKEPVIWDYVVTKGEVTLYRNGETKSIKKGFPNFKEIKDTLVNGDFSDDSLEVAWDLCCMKKQIETFSEGNITVDYDSKKITYNTFEIKHSLADHIFKRLEKGECCKGIVRFVDKIMDNPDKNVIEQLYPFLVHNDINIDNEGFITAWKGINNNRRDRWTDTIDNSVGSKPSMPRSYVCCNPKIACVAGLHAGSYEYAKGWASPFLVKVKIHPKDVCSVPEDCNHMKMRTCGYEVLEEV